MRLLLLFILVTCSARSAILNNSRYLDKLVYEIRDPNTNRSQFRSSLEKIGEYVALEALQTLKATEIEVETLTGSKASHFVSQEDPVLITILRAGIPLLQGVQKVFPDAEIGFLAMARNEKTLLAETTYIALPDITNKCVILTDTMIATGGSILNALDILQLHNPKEIIIIGAISAEAGLMRIKKKYPNVKIFSASIDPQLNEQGFIIPGLGDAGDRSFGNKFIANHN